MRILHKFPIVITPISILIYKLTLDKAYTVDIHLPLQSLLVGILKNECPVQTET